MGGSGRKSAQSTYHSLPQRPSSINYGIAATGSYRRLDSLRDAPPLRRSPFPVGEGWGKSFPCGGAGRALALTEEGRSGRER